VGDLSNFSQTGQIGDLIGSKLTISVTVTTVLVTKPFIPAGFVKRDKETVKVRTLYQTLTIVGPLPGAFERKL
jgi:hypothetical protein